MTHGRRRVPKAAFDKPCILGGGSHAFSGVKFRQPARDKRLPRFEHGINGRISTVCCRVVARHHNELVHSGVIKVVQHSKADDKVERTVLLYR